ncbi:MAG: signal peptidase I [Puniceicoccales bacterium]|jgi:signal peptidase I|nr:signal peptidase I [Puniceicoccales bacterium]
MGLVWRFRSDLIGSGDVQMLRESEGQLRVRSRDLTLEAIERGHLLLARVGGNIFPVRSHTENVELFFTVSVIALAIRAFFFQPFSIPTNSMWPTYGGMTSEISTAMDRTPLDNFAYGARTYDIISPVSGIVSIAINGGVDAAKQKSLLHYTGFRKWRFGIFPMHFRRYELFVDGVAVPIEVPADFNIEQLLVRKFFPHITSNRIADVLNVHSPEFHHGRRLLGTGVHVEASKVFFSFEIIHGDIILVNRFITHFLPPRRGDAVVFATRYVPNLHPADLYYIKRLVAKAGDILSIDEDMLYANGKLANFSWPMLCNNRKVPPYRGYFPFGSFENQMPIAVEKGNVFVMGDNSRDSYDSRYFGAIPVGAIVGKPFLHVYPFLAAAHAYAGNSRLKKKYAMHRIIHLWDRLIGND